MQRRTMLHIANRVQSASAMGITAFLALHLAAPLGAAVGLDACGTMLLTREYYQTPWLEPFLVWGSLSAHIVSSLARRLILGIPRRRPSLNSLAGYLLVPMVAVHAWTHRIAPARMGVSPSLLSYQFVSYSLSIHPISSWIIYGGLVLSACYHTASGLRTILSGRKKAARLPDSNVWRATYGSVVCGLGLGLATLAGDWSEVPSWLGKRYLEVLQAAYVA